MSSFPLMTFFALNFPLKFSIYLQIGHYPKSSKSLAHCPEFDVETLETEKEKHTFSLTSAEDQPKVKKTTDIKNVLINWTHTLGQAPVLPTAAIDTQDGGIRF